MKIENCIKKTWGGGGNWTFFFNSNKNIIKENVYLYLKNTVDASVYTAKYRNTNKYVKNSELGKSPFMNRMTKGSWSVPFFNHYVFDV